jgi:thiol-disulfide isomerase/thioredoxin
LTASSDIDGNRIGPAPEGTRATVVIVFASWCGPCRHELAMLGDIARATPELRIIGLNAYEAWGQRSDEERLRAYRADHAPWLRVVQAEPAMLAALGGVPRVPSLFLFDRAGEPVGEFRRANRPPPTRRELEQAIARALECPSDQVC